MAPKRSRGSSSSGASYDTTRFVSRDAFARYKDGLLKKVLIAERGITINEIDIGITSVVDFRGWRKFVQQPQAAVPSIVREFYANFSEAVDGRTFVRGKRVQINRQSINDFYGLPPSPTSAFHTLQEVVDLDGLLRELCVPGTSWKRNHRGEPISFPQGQL